MFCASRRGVAIPEHSFVHTFVCFVNFVVNDTCAQPGPPNAIRDPGRAFV